MAPKRKEIPSYSGYPKAASRRRDIQKGHTVSTNKDQVASEFAAGAAGSKPNTRQAPRQSRRAV